MTTGRSTTGTRVLGLLVAAGLLGSAYVHADLANRYDAIGSQITQGDLFRAQAVAATLAALWLALRPGRLAWWTALLVAAGSFAALVGTVYVALPEIGPFPELYEPIWFAEKAYAALAAGLAALLSLPAVLPTLSRRPA